MTDSSRSIAFALALLVACTADDDEDSSAGDTTGEASDSGEPAADSDSTTGDGVELTGEQLFLAYCSGCHGADAMGTTLAYELRHVDREYAHWVVRNGRAGGEFDPNAMPAFTEDALSPDQLDAIVDHLDTFPQPTTGEGLFLDYCANCHGADARTGPVQVDMLAEITDEPGKALEAVREGEGDANIGARHEFMPSVSADRLSNVQVQAIVDYVLSL